MRSRINAEFGKTKDLHAAVNEVYGRNGAAHELWREHLTEAQSRTQTYNKTTTRTRNRPQPYGTNTFGKGGGKDYQKGKNQGKPKGYSKGSYKGSPFKDSGKGMKPYEKGSGKGKGVCWAGDACTRPGCQFTHPTKKKSQSANADA